MIQLGQTPVIRKMPDSPMTIEEIPTKAVRVLVYRDQLDYDWSEFIRTPVKIAFDHEAFQEVSQSNVIDVWDRQFLDQSFKKTSGANAFLFAFNIRVPHREADILHQASATGGIFVEPRSDNGRQPCPDHRVIWLPKKTLSETLLAVKTTEAQCWVARNGDRYGIRVLRTDAPAVHKIHRPDLDFLEGDSKQSYRLGPFPFGTTKQSLQKLFRQWQWPARVGQPAGQASDNNGTFWSAVASVAPSHWVFTMSHGDVLITCVPNKEQISKPAHGVVTSHRTIQVIHKTNEMASDPQSDPWLIHDPWAKSSVAKALPKEQMAVIEAQVTKNLKEVIQSHQDTPMTADHEARFQQLEAQVKTLTTNMGQMHSSVTSFHTQQQQLNTQVAAEITSLRTNVESQASTLEGMLDSKLDTQMQRLEALLCKRLKSSNE